MNPRRSAFMRHVRSHEEYSDKYYSSVASDSEIGFKTTCEQEIKIRNCQHCDEPTKSSPAEENKETNSE